MPRNFRQPLNPAPPWTRQDLALVSVLVVAAGVLRFVGLNEGLWIDEILTLLNYVPLSPQEIVGDYHTRNNHILYSLLAHYSVAWFGDSAWTLRLPAALFGVATIPATYYLGRQLAPRHEALLASALLTASYHHVWFSQNARGYTGLLLGTLLLSSCFIRLLVMDKPGYRSAIAYAIIATLACWMHLTAALVVVAHGIIWLAVISPLPGKEKTGLKPTVALGLSLAGLLSLALYSPVLTRLSQEFVRAVAVPVPPIAWKSIDWVLAEVWNAALVAVPGGWPVILLGALVIITGSRAYWKQGIVPVAILILPILVTVIMTAHHSIFFPRFLFGSMGFFLLLAVRGGFVMSRAVVPRLSAHQLTIIGLFFALAAAARVPGAWQPKQDFVAAAEFIEAHRVEGDAVVCTSGTVRPLHDYLGMDCQYAVTLSELNGVEQAHSRTWLVYMFPDLPRSLDPEIWSKVQSDYTPVVKIAGTVRGGDIVIVLKSPRVSAGVP